MGFLEEEEDGGGGKCSLGGGGEIGVGGGAEGNEEEVGDRVFSVDGG